MDININEFIRKNRINGYCPRVECKDGFTMSIQASRGHYCSPRSGEGKYTTVEIGFPSQFTSLCKAHQVVGFVPIEEVEELLDEHGGIRGISEGD